MNTRSFAVRPKRLAWAPLLVCVLLPVVAFSPVASADDETPADDFYDDVGEDHIFYDPIKELHAVGLFEGTGADCEEGNFCPGKPLKRWQMAVWMVRFMDGQNPEPVEQSRFEDVDDDVWWMPYVERMADLDVTKGCRSDPPKFCPMGDVTRGQMASFLVQAFDLPPAPSAGFEDVDEKTNVHADNINRLYAAEITVGCTKDPFRYCTRSPVKKGQMAAFIAGAAAWRAEQANIDPEDLPGQPQNVAARFVDVSGVRKDQLLVEWQRPSSRYDDISHYLLQWRWEEEATFGSFSFRQQRVEINNDPNDLDASAAGLSVELFDLNAHAIRVVTVKNNGKQSASAEALSPVSPAVLARNIKEVLVDVYGDVDPWLQQTWEYMASKDGFFRIIDKSSSRSAFIGLSHVTDNEAGLTRLEARRFNIKAYKTLANNFSHLNTYIHEMAHIYTLTSGLPDNPAPIAIAHLYFQHFINEHSISPAACEPEEMFADMLVLASDADIVEYYVYGAWNKYACTGTHKPTAEAKQVAGEALSGRSPQWFYDTFQRSDGSLDLDAVWELIGSVRERYNRTAIVYQLKDAFGGYCDTQAARSLVGGSSAGNSGNTWRDGGCR